MRIDLPEFREWSVAAVWLLKGVVYSEDQRVWNILLSNASVLESISRVWGCVWWWTNRKVWLTSGS